MRRAFSGVQLAEVLIDQRGGFFQDAEGANQLGRHGVVADVEMDQRARGLRALVAVGGHFDLAHAVGFGAGLDRGGIYGFRHCGSWMIEGKSYLEMMRSE